MVDTGAVPMGAVVNMTAAFRMGVKQHHDTTRNICVKFSDFSAKLKLFSNISKIDRVVYPGVYVSDDLSADQQEQRKEMRCIAALARSKGNVSAKVKGAKLIIDEEEYAYSEMDDLPNGLSMEKAKTVEIQDGTAYQSHHSYLSNMYECPIKHESHIFNSSEQLYWYLAATANNDEAMAKRLKRCSNPYQAKRMAKKTRIIDPEWETNKYEVMRRVIKMKFDQNTTIRLKLIDTKGTLFEATTEKGWGCGLTLAKVNDINLLNVKANKMGEILMEYRESVVNA